MSLLGWVAAPILLAGFGWALVTLTGARVSVWGRVTAPAICFITGTAALNVLTTLLAVVGAPIRPWPATGPIVIATIGVALAVRRRRTSPRPVPWTWRREVAPVVTALLGAPIVLTAAIQHFVSNDEYAIWALKGRALASAGHVDSFFFSGNPLIEYSSRDYPLLLPSLQVWAEGWQGAPSSQLAHALVATLSVSALVVMSAALGRVVGVAASIVAVVSILALSGFAVRATAFMADAPLACCALALLAVLLLHVAPMSHPPPRLEWIVVATALAAACGGLKNEGLAFALAILVAAAVARRDVWHHHLVPLAGVLMGFVPWALWCRVHGVHNDFVNSGTVGSSTVRHLSRIGGLTSAMVEHWPGVLLIVPLAVVGWIALWLLDRSPVAVVLALSSLLTLAAIVGTYIVSPKYGAEFLASNMPRVLMLPAALAGISMPITAALLLRSGRTSPQVAPPSGA